MLDIETEALRNTYHFKRYPYNFRRKLEIIGQLEQTSTKQRMKIFKIQAALSCSFSINRTLIFDDHLENKNHILHDILGIPAMLSSRVERDILFPCQVI